MACHLNVPMQISLTSIANQLELRLEQVEPDSTRLSRYALAMGYLLFMCSEPCQAQYEAANWYFGERAGLDFNCDPPRARRSALYHTREACLH